LLTLAREPFYATVNGFKTLEARIETNYTQSNQRKIGYSWIRSLMLDKCSGNPRNYRNVVYSHGRHVGGHLPRVTLKFDGLSWNNEPGDFMVGDKVVDCPDGHWEIYHGSVLSLVLYENVQQPTITIFNISTRQTSNHNNNYLHIIG
jgi:hypothetical protein